MTVSSMPIARVPRRQVVSWLLGAGAVSACGSWGFAAAAQSPPLMLAHSYRQGMPVAAYGVSEKYDGIRGYWDGSRLWTRGGELVAAPAWFSAGFPAQAMDGELWAGRGQFQQAVSVTRRQTPDDNGWRAIRFMVFDLPAQGGNFAARLAVLPGVVAVADRPWLTGVAQTVLPDHASLHSLLRRTVQDGGEGLVLHRLDSPYRSGRSRDLLKYKPDHDDDARVLGHIPGRGKYLGMMGALLVETPEGLRFKLGGGFDDAQRRDPPPVGSWISYRFRGETDAGIPRFASFLRLRADLS